MKFDIGQKVKSKTTGKTGEIRMYKEETFEGVNGIVTTKQFYVNFGAYYNEWINERLLEMIPCYDPMNEFICDYKFTDKFEDELLNLMVNVNLDEKQHEMVTMWHEQREL